MLRAGTMFWYAVAVLVLAGPVRAERKDPTVSPINVAQELLDRAEEAEKQGSYALAVQYYQKFLELQPDLRTYSSRGPCTLKRNQSVEAANAFQAFLSLPCQYTSHDWCEDARRALERLRPPLGRVQLSGPAGLSFRLDRQPPRTTPV